MHGHNYGPLRAKVEIVDKVHLRCAMDFMVSMQTPSDRCHGHAEPKTTPALPALPLMLSSDVVNLKEGEHH